jgi:type IV secretory pathway TrbL component
MGLFKSISKAEKGFKKFGNSVAKGATKTFGKIEKVADTAVRKTGNTLAAAGGAVSKYAKLAAPIATVLAGPEAGALAMGIAGAGDAAKRAGKATLKARKDVKSFSDKAKNTVGNINSKIQSMDTNGSILRQKPPQPDNGDDAVFG